MPDLFDISAYHYVLPQELIAQHPVAPRDRARLMLIDRAKGTFEDLHIGDLKDLLEQGDSLVANDSRVFPSRLHGLRPSGGKVEVLLTKRLECDLFEALVKPGKKLPVGAEVSFGPELRGKIAAVLPDGSRWIRLVSQGDISEILYRLAHIPLPSYIRGGVAEESDQINYQTVFAKEEGSVAAPTAGLHFTKELLQDLFKKGVDWTSVTLHVGPGTFRPVKTVDIREHRMHHEEGSISVEAAAKLNHRSTKHRQICVGTTCCRSLESAADERGVIRPGSFSTDIFIYPGYQFRYVQHLMTNFHLPGSTLLMLVSAFAGYDLMREAYARAVSLRYRFFSYGDAMLIL